MGEGEVEGVGEGEGEVDGVGEEGGEVVGVGEGEGEGRLWVRVRGGCGLGRG